MDEIITTARLRQLFLKEPFYLGRLKVEELFTKVLKSFRRNVSHSLLISDESSIFRKIS
jgi:hypothetical protein